MELLSPSGGRQINMTILINFKIKIDHVPVVLEQKFFQIWSPLVEYCQNLQ